MGRGIGRSQRRIGIGVATSYAGGGVPFQNDALFILNGTLVEDGGSYYFEDQTSNDRNFLITDKDFTASYFPYKSAATISAPVGDATLIAADVNNFLYAADGTPNQIPVVSLFQDIDYEHIGFSRHVARVVDGNGVETTEPHVKDFVWYQAALSGGDLTRAQTYYLVPTEDATAKWVSVTGNDSTGDGSKALPYLTIDHAQAQLATDETLYVKSGNYDETVALDQGCTIYGIGLSQMIRSTGNCIAVAGGGAGEDIVVKGMQLETVVGYRPIQSGQAITSMAVDRCHLTNTTNSQPTIYSIATAGPLVVTNTIINKGYITWDLETTCVDCYFNEYGGSCITTHNTLNLNNCYINSPATPGNNGVITMLGNCDINILDCEWTYKILFDTAVAHDCDLDIDYCTGNSTASPGIPSILSMTSLTGTIDCSITNCTLISNGVTGTFISYENDGTFVFNDNTVTGLDGTILFKGTDLTQTAEIKRNTLIGVAGSGLNPGIQCESLVATIEDNLLDSDSPIIKVFNDLASAQASIITGNISHARNGSSPFIHLGIEGDTSTYGKSDGTVISENSCFGPRYYGNAVGSQHGIFVYAQACEVKHNRIIGVFLGMVIKSAGISYNTKAFNNLLIDCNSAFTIKGAVDVYLYGNTVVLTSDTDGVTTTGLQHQYDNLHAGSYSTGLLFKNNIFADYRTSDDEVHFSTTSDDMVDSDYDYNVFYKANGTSFCNFSGTKTFAQWKTASSEDANSVEDNPDLTDPSNYDLSLITGSPAIGAGATLDAAYDDGLDASTDWGDDSTIPVIVTKQQSVPWDIGAYVS